LTYLPSLTKPILDGDDFVAALGGVGLSPQKNYEWHTLIFPEQSGDRFHTRYSWLIFRREKTGRFSPVRTVTYRSAERSARIPGLEFLPAKRIAIIGCGSIGSKIACSLASSGVNEFLLIDKDAMEPANSVRHECGVVDFGKAKVEALAVRIMSLNPDSCGTCDTFAGNLFGELSSELRATLHSALERCDLIVNATGVQGLSRAICELSGHYSIPSVHVSVTNGAWSGEVFRYLPCRSNCWQCFQEAFSDPPSGEPAPLGHLFGPGCDQPTFTGTGYELDIVAGLATSFLVDTLRVADGGNSEYVGDYLLWEGRDSTGKLLQRATARTVPARETCDVCGKQQ
jgi:molybdopterin/thiamine biosynthesis adenylyltransferase